MTNEQKKEGLDYAENIFLSDDNHLKLDREHLKKFFDLNGKTILDFGCGMGGMTLWMAKNYNCKIIGLDIDANLLDIANTIKEKYNFNHIEFQKRDIANNPFEEKFDFILMNDVAEHIHKDIIESVFISLKKMLKDDGVIFISYPPWEGPYASHLNGVMGFPWSQYLPKKMLHKMLVKRNKQLVNENDLLNEYYQLNHLNNKSLMRIAAKANLQLVSRVSHTKLNSIGPLKKINFSFLKFLVSKEFVVFK